MTGLQRRRRWTAWKRGYRQTDLFDKWSTEPSLRVYVARCIRARFVGFPSQNKWGRDSWIREWGWGQSWRSLVHCLSFFDRLINIWWTRNLLGTVWTALVWRCTRHPVWWPKLPLLLPLLHANVCSNTERSRRHSSPARSANDANQIRQNDRLFDEDWNELLCECVVDEMAVGGRRTTSLSCLITSISFDKKLFFTSRQKKESCKN